MLTFVLSVFCVFLFVGFCFLYTSQAVGWESVSRMTYFMSSGNENLAHSNQLTFVLCRKIKTLGESDDESESAAAWVIKSRQLEEDQRLAEQRV